MSVNIERATSDVSVEPEPASGQKGAPPSRWDELDRAKASHAAATRDDARTAARDYDD